MRKKSKYTTFIKVKRPPGKTQQADLTRFLGIRNSKLRK